MFANFELLFLLYLILLVDAEMVYKSILVGNTPVFNNAPRHPEESGKSLKQI